MSSPPKEFGEDYLPPGYIPGQYPVTVNIPKEKSFNLRRIVQHAHDTWEVVHNGDRFGKYVQMLIYHSKERPMPGQWGDVFVGARLFVPGEDKPRTYRMRTPHKRDSLGQLQWKEGWKDFRAILVHALQQYEKHNGKSKQSAEAQTGESQQEQGSSVQQRTQGPCSTTGQPPRGNH